MSVATRRRPAARALPRPPARRVGVAAVAVALAATAVLLARPIPGPPPPPPDRSLAAVWPKAQRADIPGNLADGTLLTALYFVDVRTAVGTAATPDGRGLRLVVRSPDGAVRELRRHPQDSSPDFGNVASDGETLVWSEQTAGRPVELWAAGVGGGPARRLTADAGDAVFVGSQYDIQVRDGRAFWAVRRGADTEIRNVRLTGGPVTRRTEPGRWEMAAWPWISAGGLDDTAPARLREIGTDREIRVPASGAELVACSPAWCRVQVLDGGVRVDLMRPDGTGRQQAGGPTASAAVPDVALLDRFAVLREEGTDAGLDDTAALLVYDLSKRRTVEITGAAAEVFARGRILWWSTGDVDSLTWHTLDLRTV